MLTLPATLIVPPVSVGLEELRKPSEALPSKVIVPVNVTFVKTERARIVTLLNETPEAVAIEGPVKVTVPLLWLKVMPVANEHVPVHCRLLEVEVKFAPPDTARFAKLKAPLPPKKVPPVKDELPALEVIGVVPKVIVPDFITRAPEREIAPDAPVKAPPLIVNDAAVPEFTVSAAEPKLNVPPSTWNISLASPVPTVRVNPF